MSKRVIVLRCSAELKDILEYYSRNYGISLSEVVRNMVELVLSEYSIKLEKTIQKKIKNFVRKGKIQEISKEWKEHNRNTYLIKNFLTILRGMLLSSYILTRKINMDIVEEQIKYVLKIYKNLPLKTRNTLKEEIEFIKKLRNEGFIQEKFNYMLDLKNRKLLK